MFAESAEARFFSALTLAEALVLCEGTALRVVVRELDLALERVQRTLHLLGTAEQLPLLWRLLHDVSY